MAKLIGRVFFRGLGSVRCGFGDVLFVCLFALGCNIAYGGFFFFLYIDERCFDRRYLVCKSIGDGISGIYSREFWLKAGDRAIVRYYSPRYSSMILPLGTFFNYRAPGFNEPSIP